MKGLGCKECNAANPQCGNQGEGVISTQLCEQSCQFVITGVFAPLKCSGQSRGLLQHPLWRFQRVMKAPPGLPGVPSIRYGPSQMFLKAAPAESRLLSNGLAPTGRFSSGVDSLSCRESAFCYLHCFSVFPLNLMLHVQPQKTLQRCFCSAVVGLRLIFPAKPN